MKKFFLVICFIIGNFSLLYAGGGADNNAKGRWAEKRWSGEALKAGLKRADNAIIDADNHRDNWEKLTSAQAYESSEIVLRKADDVAWRGAINYKQIPKIQGRWSGVPGDSNFFPDLDRIPKRGTQIQKTNNAPKTWKEIGEQNLVQAQHIPEFADESRLAVANNFRKFSSGEIGFTYRQGEPDFSPFSYNTLDVRSSGYRILTGRTSRFIPLEQRRSLMDLGDEILAKKWNWSTTDVTNFRRKWSLTWHERIDMHTIDLVPNDIHYLITHRNDRAVVTALAVP